jgi:DmsE family decaheme c-type cytochrome
MRTGVRYAWRWAVAIRPSHAVAIGLVSLLLASCAYPPRRQDVEAYAGWSGARNAQGLPGKFRPPVRRKAVVESPRTIRRVSHEEAPREVRKVAHPPRLGPFPPRKVALPAIPGAEFIREDELCMTCHEAHVVDFKAKNVHRNFSCEECHGPASEHVTSRGLVPGNILNVKRLSKPQQAEMCLRCHETQVTPPHVREWRTSTHANRDVSCTDCHTSHHDVPRGTPAVNPPVGSRPNPRAAGRLATYLARPKADPSVRPAAAQAPDATPTPDVLPSLRGTSRALLGTGADTCYRCHDRSHGLTDAKGPHRQVPGSTITCTSCHDPSGTLSDATGRESCLSCHDQKLSPTWHTATHNRANLLCTDCHTPHPALDEAQTADLARGNLAALPEPIAVVQAVTCVRCHQETALNLKVPDAHQVGGKNNFQCTTCHNPHGQVNDATRKDLCLTCHQGPLSGTWHSGTHNQAGMFCTDCHEPHHELNPKQFFDLGRGNYADLPRPMAIDQKTSCVRCHQETLLNVQLAEPHQVGGKDNFQCTTCHNPHGQVNDATRKDLCLTCHQGPLSTKWHSSVHEQAGLVCTDCHKPHHQLDPRQAANLAQGGRAGLPMPMAIDQSVTCIRCHQEARQIVELAGPHQVGGANEFQCSTCHDPHGKIIESTRKDLCLKCHTGSPTTAWHSSIHNLQGIACTDCHDPHPDPNVQQNVDIRHTNIRRPQRIPMSVNDPDTCYKCHPQIYAMTLMPSHHPIFEGKMVCSSCHDSHGQAMKLLNEPQTNLVCYKCHSEVQGPFVYEHPPVTQDCSICHNPHGSVQNNLLHQPTTFLCLRCHSGHRNGPPFHDAGLLPDIGKSRPLQKAFFTDCTQCHSQVHGSDVPSPNNAHALAR